MNGPHLDPQTRYPGYQGRQLQLYHSDANKIKNKSTEGFQWMLCLLARTQ